MFDGQKIRISETVDAKKLKIANEQAWNLLKKAREIVVGRGKKYLLFTPSESNKDEILSQCLGRTGNLRVPALKIGNRYIIGFNQDMYQKFVG